MLGRKGNIIIRICYINTLIIAVKESVQRVCATAPSHCRHQESEHEKNLQYIHH